MGAEKLIVGGIIGVIVIIVLFFGYLGFVPGVSDLMGTNKPRDLGVTFSEASYASGLDKVPGAVVINPEYLCVTCKYTSSGAIPVNTSFTESEVTAMINKRNNKVGPISNVQVKFNKDGTLETSGILNTFGMKGVPELNGPVYVKGKIVKNSSRSVSVKLDSAEFSRVGVPKEQIPEVEKAINSLLQETFANNPGLVVNSIEVVDGKVNFDGTLPKTVSGIQTTSN